MNIKARVAWTFTLALPFLPVEPSLACSCAQLKTLQELYDAADSIVVGKVSGCASGQPDERGYCKHREAVFDVVEMLKGSKEDLPPERRRLGNPTTCSLSDGIGTTHLLFLIGDADPSACRGSGSLEGEASAGPMKTLELLREYRDGLSSDLSPRWIYGDDGRACTITHSFGEAVLKFDYYYATPQPADRPLQPMFSVHLRRGMLVEPAVLQIDGVQVPLLRETLQINPPVKPTRTITFTRDVARGEAVIALLERMSKAADVVVTGDQNMSGRPDPTSTWPLRTASRTTRLAPAAAQFKACMNAHAGSVP